MDTATIRIPLTQGYTALVDAADYPRIAPYRWYAFPCDRRVYAATNKRLGDPSGLMHRIILDPPKGIQIDHIDLDGLNNSRSNLRLCTNQQNNFNRAPAKGRRFKGACLTPRGTWVAYITVDYKMYNLGRFPTEEDAARAYDAAAKQHFGAFARLNFPD